MIFAERKPMAEILEKLNGYKRFLLSVVLLVLQNVP